MENTLPRTAIERERKYLIEYPSDALLAGLESAKIEQTYLLNPPDTRIRAILRGDSARFVMTQKTNLPDDPAARLETERTLSPGEYHTLLAQRDPRRKTIRKTRYFLPHCGLTFEIDVFEGWKAYAVMEVEYESGDTIVLPPRFNVLADVTGDPAYENYALSISFPAFPR